MAISFAGFNISEVMKHALVICHLNVFMTCCSLVSDPFLVPGTDNCIHKKAFMLFNY